MALKRKTIETQEQNVPEQMTFKNALVLEERLANELIAVLQEMPIKYNGMIMPLLQSIQRSPRANVSLNNPQKIEKEEPNEE